MIVTMTELLNNFFASASGAFGSVLLMALIILAAFISTVAIDLIKGGYNVGVDDAEQGIGLNSWLKAIISNPRIRRGASPIIKAGPATHLINGEPTMVFEQSQTNSSLF